MVSVSYYFCDCQCVIFDFEADVAALVGQAIDSLRVVLVLRPGVFFQDFSQGFKTFFAEGFFEFFGCFRGNYDFETLPGGAVGEAASDTGVGVGVFDVGLDVINRSAVSEVGPEDGDYAIFSVDVAYLY